MPNWKFYDNAAFNLESGMLSDEEWARNLETMWLLPGYTFQSNIPAYDLTGFTHAGVRDYPTAVDPYFWTPKYPPNWPEVIFRGSVILQHFLMPGRQTQAERGSSIYEPNDNYLFGESHLWHDTWNNVIRWRCPTARWVPNPQLPPVQHLIFYLQAGPPMMLLSLDAPIASNQPYEFDWSGGLYGNEEDRMGIVLNIVEA